ncbi:hypothetical protein NQZ79_g6883 [Umbelopsis isabellina]|nr:hypothetical protein NQZ79_g6883 [Umbelopsis isabellina]
MEDEKISNFCAVTSCNPDIAQSYLQLTDKLVQVSDWNVETALSLYFENSGAPLGPPEPIPETTNPYSGLNDDDEDSDEALARQLQNEQYGGEQSDNVRAPIAPKTDVLVGDDSFEHTFSRRNPILSRHPVFNQGDSSSNPIAPEAFRNFESEMESLQGGRSQSPATSDKTRRLADLFRPPFDMMYQGDFEHARNFAKDNKKWLMVNLQDPTEFACQVMNRDLWSEQAVKDVVNESFVFLQYGSESPEGKRYVTYYPIETYPHVAIIDARTVTEFLESKANQKQPTTKKPKVADMTEEEQLNAAIAASLGNNASNNEASSSVIESPAETQEVDEEAVEEERQASVLDSIAANKRDEPTDPKTSTRIQLRLPDGSRIVRRFNKIDPVRYIFEFVKAEVAEAETRPFEQLIDLIDKDIKEAGLENSAINFNFS